jgi:hypothetical protein
VPRSSGCGAAAMTSTHRRPRNRSR